MDGQGCNPRRAEAHITEQVVEMLRGARMFIVWGRSVSQVALG